MFFATGVWELFATHPPLAERITRIDRFWKASRSSASREHQPRQPAEPGWRASPPRPPRTRPAAAGPATAGGGSRPPAEPIASVGRLDPADIARARSFADGLPPPLREAAHEPFGSRAVIYLLLLEPTPPSATGNWAASTTADPGVVRRPAALALAGDVPRERGFRWSLSPRPAQGSLPEQYARFRENLGVLIAADERLSFFEWSLRKVVLHVLEPRFEGRRRRRAGRPTPGDVSVVFSALARRGPTMTTTPRPPSPAARRWPGWETSRTSPGTPGSSPASTRPSSGWTAWPRNQRSGFCEAWSRLRRPTGWCTSESGNCCGWWPPRSTARCRRWSVSFDRPRQAASGCNRLQGCGRDGCHVFQSAAW